MILGKFHPDRTLFEAWNHGLDIGKSSPAARFRLVKYYNLPRFMIIYLFKLVIVNRCVKLG